MAYNLWFLMFAAVLLLRARMLGAELPGLMFLGAMLLAVWYLAVLFFYLLENLNDLFD